jgi:hypothetical protein
MTERFRTAEAGGRPQAQTEPRNDSWRAPPGLTRAQLEAAQRVIRAHADRLAAHWRDPSAGDRVGAPIEH